MNGNLKATDISQIEPNWNHPVLPGQAVQGSLLFTTTDFVEPPQSSNMFKWIPMEDIVGLGNIKLTLDTDKQVYTLWKTRQHLNSNGEYEYDWVTVGEWNVLSQEVIDFIENAAYLEYKFSYENNNLKVIGVRKDQTTEDTLLDIMIPSQQDFNDKVSELNNSIKVVTNKLTMEIEERTTADNNLFKAIDSEITERAEADGIIERKLNTEITNRQNEDNALQTKLDNETVSRANADTTLQTNINTEKNLRESNDTALKTMIQNEASTRESADNLIKESIAKKQDKLTAGTNITISADNVISAKGGDTGETEEWTFTLSDGSTLTRKVLINTTTYENWTFTLSDGSTYTRNVGIKE